MIWDGWIGCEVTGDDFEMTGDDIRWLKMKRFQLIGDNFKMIWDYMRRLGMVLDD